MCSTESRPYLSRVYVVVGVFVWPSKYTIVSTHTQYYRYGKHDVRIRGRMKKKNEKNNHDIFFQKANVRENFGLSLRRRREETNPLTAEQCETVQRRYTLHTRSPRSGRIFQYVIVVIVANKNHKRRVSGSQFTSVRQSLLANASAITTVIPARTS